MIRVTLGNGGRVNPSLVFAGCDPIVHALEACAGAPLQVFLGEEFSGQLTLDGQQPHYGPFSPPLDYCRFALLRVPRDGQLIVTRDHQPPLCVPVKLLPLHTWDMRDRFYGPTAGWVDPRPALAALVDEHSPDIVQLVSTARSLPRPAGDIPVIKSRAERLFVTIRKFFRAKYLVDREHFANYEQAVRFTRHILADRGGTCCDLSLLFASAALAAELQPVLCFFQDPTQPNARHLMVAVRRQDDPPRQAVVLDAASLADELRAGLMLIEPNCLACRRATFDSALQKAIEQQNTLVPLWGIDLFAARFGGRALNSLPAAVRSPDDPPPPEDRPNRCADETYTMSCEAAERSLRTYAVELVGAAAGVTRRRYPLGGRLVSIGRREGPNRFAIQGYDISRDHAHIFAHQGRVFIEDLNSANGTYLGLRRLVPFRPARLRANQEFALGFEGRVRLRLVRVAGEE